MFAWITGTRLIQVYAVSTLEIKLTLDVYLIFHLKQQHYLYTLLSVLLLELIANLHEHFSCSIFKESSFFMIR